MDEPNESTVLTVTFDTNTLEAVVRPVIEPTQHGTETERTVVRAAIQTARILGFFSETIITVEGIKNAERSKLLGQTRVLSGASASGGRQRGLSVSFQFSVGMRHAPRVIDSRAVARVQAALELGIRPLRTPARFGEQHLDQKDFPLFGPSLGTPEFESRMNKVHKMASEIERRGLGRAVAVELGKRFSERDDVRDAELWHQGLGRARDEKERNGVARAISEWADGDSIAAHYGFGIRLFCTEDSGRTARGNSVLAPVNRKWLSDEFGIRIVTFAELAKRVAR